MFPSFEKLILFQQTKVSVCHEKHASDVLVFTVTIFVYIYAKIEKSRVICFNMYFYLSVKDVFVVDEHPHSSD